MINMTENDLTQEEKADCIELSHRLVSILNKYEAWMGYTVLTALLVTISKASYIDEELFLKTMKNAYRGKKSDG